MKDFRLWTFLLFTSLLTGCGKTNTSISSDKDLSINRELTGKWVLESVVQENDTILRPSVKDGIYDVSLTFKDMGELEATSSTNYLTGFYETAQLNAIHIGGDGTERKETSWGNLFVNALPHVNLYNLEPDQLILSCDNNSQLIFNRLD